MYPLGGHGANVRLVLLKSRLMWYFNTTLGLRTGPKQMNGRFQPGRSGNPGGRPRAAHSITELARQHAPDAIKTLADIAKNGTPGARVSAAIALLDRAYGKAPTFSTSDNQTFKRAINMTDDELAAIVEPSLP
jgi:hypothetical protein